jgi:hypothetical protein
VSLLTHAFIVCYNDNLLLVFQFARMSRSDGESFWKIFGAENEDRHGKLFISRPYKKELKICLN